MSHVPQMLVSSQQMSHVTQMSHISHVTQMSHIKHVTQECVTCATNVCLLTTNVTQAMREAGTMVMVMGTEFPVGLGHLIYAGIE